MNKANCTHKQGLPTIVAQLLPGKKETIANSSCVKEVIGAAGERSAKPFK